MLASGRRNARQRSLRAARRAYLDDRNELGVNVHMFKNLVVAAPDGIGREVRAESCRLQRIPGGAVALVDHWAWRV